MLSMLGIGELVVFRESGTVMVAELRIITATKDTHFINDEIWIECMVTNEEVKNTIRQIGKVNRHDNKILLSFVVKYEGFKTSFPDPFESKPSQLVSLNGHLHKVKKWWVNNVAASIVNSTLTYQVSH